MEQNREKVFDARKAFPRLPVQFQAFSERIFFFGDEAHGVHAEFPRDEHGAVDVERLSDNDGIVYAEHGAGAVHRVVGGKPRMVKEHKAFVRAVHFFDVGKGCVHFVVVLPPVVARYEDFLNRAVFQKFHAPGDSVPEHERNRTVAVRPRPHDNRRVSARHRLQILENIRAHGKDDVRVGKKDEEHGGKTRAAQNAGARS